MERQTGIRPAALDGPPLPSWGAHLWQWWAELHAGRQPGALGPAAITWQDLDAWARLTASAPHPAEIRLLLEIDRCWLEAQDTAPRPPSPPPAAKGSAR